MAIVAITLEYGKQQVVDLGLPLEITCRVLTESLAQAFHLESDVGETLVLVDKGSAANRVLAANATLGDLEILHGTKLALVSQKNIEARPVPQGRASGKNSYQPRRKFRTALRTMRPLLGFTLRLNTTIGSASITEPVQSYISPAVLMAARERRLM